MFPEPCIVLLELTNVLFNVPVMTLSEKLVMLTVPPPVNVVVAAPTFNVAAVMPSACRFSVPELTYEAASVKVLPGPTLVTPALVKPDNAL